MTRRTKRVWIVEVKWTDRGEQKGWHPTQGCALTEESGRQALKAWQNSNPCDRFRLVQYRA